MWYEITEKDLIPTALSAINSNFHPASASRSFVDVDNDNVISRYMQVRGDEELEVIYTEAAPGAFVSMNGLTWNLPNLVAVVKLVHCNDESYTQHATHSRSYTLEELSELYKELHWLVLRIAEGPGHGIKSLNVRDTTDDYTLRIFERELLEKQGVKIKFVDYIYFDDCAPKYSEDFTERLDDNEDCDVLISAIFRDNHPSREKLRFYAPSLNTWIKEDRVVDGKYFRGGLWETELSFLRVRAPE